jgi:hypothetical protein
LERHRARPEDERGKRGERAFLQSNMTATIFSWIVMAISTAGYAGVVAMMAIESACIPLPSEVPLKYIG